MLSQPVWICGPVGMETYTFQEKVSEKIVFVYATALCHLGQMNVFEFEFAVSHVSMLMDLLPCHMSQAYHSGAVRYFDKSLESGVCDSICLITPC
jgi:hypothetical protein